MKRFDAWLMRQKDCPCWHFWNPLSGLIGGLIFAVILNVLVWGVIHVLR